MAYVRYRALCGDIRLWKTVPVKTIPLTAKKRNEIGNYIRTTLSYNHWMAHIEDLRCGSEYFNDERYPVEELMSYILDNTDGITYNPDTSMVLCKGKVDNVHSKWRYCCDGEGYESTCEEIDFAKLLILSFHKLKVPMNKLLEKGAKRGLTEQHILDAVHYCEPFMRIMDGHVYLGGYDESRHT